MSQSFPDLLQRTRAGDRDASQELWLSCAPCLWQTVRCELSKYGLLRNGSAEEQVQSIAVLFFDRLRRGKLDALLNSTQTRRQLLGLLRKMAHGSVVDWIRNHDAQRRGHQDEQDAAKLLPNIEARELDPCAELMHNELLQHCCEMLTSKQLRIAELVRGGHTWRQVAAAVGDSQGAVQKQFYRARDRVRRWLVHELR